MELSWYWVIMGMIRVCYLLVICFHSLKILHLLAFENWVGLSYQQFRIQVDSISPSVQVHRCRVTKWPYDSCVFLEAFHRRTYGLKSLLYVTVYGRWVELWYSSPFTLAGKGVVSSVFWWLLMKQARGSSSSEHDKHTSFNSPSNES